MPVRVTNTPGVLSAATAELAVTLMLAAARRVAEGDGIVRAGKWDAHGADTFLGRNLVGTRLEGSFADIEILPTHRVVTGIENFSSPDFITKASAYYTITELEDNATPANLIDALTNSPAPSGTDSFLAVTGDGNYLLTPKPEAIAPLLANLPAKRDWGFAPADVAGPKSSMWSTSG